MISVRFDVNDEALRGDFLREKLFTALADLSPSALPRWGGMNPHQMVEHLIWALEISNGLFSVPCKLHPKLVAKIRGFLFDNTPTSHEFMNPELKAGLPPTRFSTLPEAISELRRAADSFMSEPAETRDRPRTHPVFGDINHEEWERAHFKHFYHHLLQFDLLESA
jgi:hypothetical protein